MPTRIHPKKESTPHATRTSGVRTEPPFPPSLLVSQHSALKTFFQIFDPHGQKATGLGVNSSKPIITEERRTRRRARSNPGNTRKLHDRLAQNLIKLTLPGIRRAVALFFSSGL